MATNMLITEERARDIQAGLRWFYEEATTDELTAFIKVRSGEALDAINRAVALERSVAVSMNHAARIVDMVQVIWRAKHDHKKCNAACIYCPKEKRR